MFINDVCKHLKYKVYNANSTKDDIYKPSFRKYDYESFIYLFTVLGINNMYYMHPKIRR